MLGDLGGGGSRPADINNAGQVVGSFYTAIVTDLGLPGIDGYELCRRLHRSERLGRIPIVAITGRYLSLPDIERAKREGCQTVLIKPFVTDDLIAEIRKALNSG